jgi:dihydroorotate dehydrogenase
MLAAGARVVGLGTALFRDPALPGRILAELPGLLADHGFSEVEGVTGASQNLDSKAPPELERSER